MNIVGLATTSPMVALSMIDASKWRSLVYAETDACRSRWTKAFNAKPDGRRTVCVLLGASYLPRVLERSSSLNAVLVFDDVQNLSTLAGQLPGFEIADIEKDSSGAGAMPLVLSGSDLAQLLDQQLDVGEPSLLTQLTSALGKRKSSALENTNRMPVTEAVEISSAQKALSVIQTQVEGSKVSFSVVLDLYVKYMFNMVDRSVVTAQVTKQLPDSVKELWHQLLEFASSFTGEMMADAFVKLCESTDPDYRIGHAVAEFGLKPFSGDFAYFTALIPPAPNYEFVVKGSVKADKETMNSKPLASGSRTAQPRKKVVKVKAR